MSLFNTLLFLVIIQAELYLQYPKQNQIPTTTPVLNITEEIIQILERKLQIKISWNVSNSCDLLPLFESLNFNANCDLNKVNLDFLIGYRFEEGLKTLPFHHLNLDDSKETIIKAIRFPTRSILFEWNPSFNHLEFVSNVCTGAWSRSKCFKELHTDIQILLRIMEENLMEIYFRNETFSHEFLDKYRIIFTRENDGFDYIDSKIIIELMNTSIISLPFNITQGYVIYDSSELAGQVIKVHFRAVWKENFHHLEYLNETLGLEINSNIFTLEPIKKRPQSYVVYNTNMTVNDLRTLSNPILINIPFKNKILNVTKLNSSHIEIDWSRPNGDYNFISLVCIIGTYRSRSIHSKNTVRGLCSHQPSLSGYFIDIFINVDKTGVEFRASEYSLLIKPERVKNFQLISSTPKTLKFSWDPPNGIYSYVNIACIDLKTNVLAYQINVSNTTFQAECINLTPNTQYKVRVKTIATVSNETQFEIEEYNLATGSEISNITQLSLSDLTRVNFSNIVSNEVISVLNSLQTNLTSIKNQTLVDENRLINFLNETSIILENIALRNTLSEKEEFVLPFINLIDSFMDESRQILGRTGNNSNKLSFSLEVISNKLELSTSNSFTRDFKNFFVKTQIINSSKVDYSDMGFATTSNNQESIFNINSDSIDYFFGLNGLKYAAFFNKKPLENLINQNKTPRITYVAYSSPKLFSGSNVKSVEDLELDCKSSQIGPNVISASQIVGLEPTDELINLIYQEQRNEKYCDERKINYTYDCVYWNYEKNEWQNFGCKHILIEKNNKTLHKCTCNHTTNFALLMVADNLGFCDWCDTILFYVSMVGISLSIVGLISTIFYDFLITVLPSREEAKPEGLMKRYSSMSKEYLKVITTWCTTLLIMNCTYIAFSFYKYDDSISSESQQQQQEASCIAIGVILHFFLLSSFCFSFCITFIQFLIVYKSFKVFRCIYLSSVVFSFGIPAIAVGIVIGIDRKAYINPNNYCWLHSWYAIFGAIVPIGIILLINLIIFLIITVSHSSLLKTRNKYLHKKERFDEKGIKQEFILIISCFVNTGLTWLFGFLVTIPGSDGWIYARFVYGLIFCILNSTQGFQIFVTYFIISKRRRSILKEKLKIQIVNIKHKISRPDSSKSTSIKNRTPNY